MLLSKKVKLSEVTKGDVVRFDYTQPVDDEVNRLGKVVAVRDTVKEPIRTGQKFYYRYNDLLAGKFARSRFLVTVDDGKGPKAFYADPRSLNARRYNALGRLVVRLRRIFA